MQNIDFEVESYGREQLAEVALWRAVIHQAIKDCYELDTSAMSFMETKSRYNDMIFEFAGIDQEKAASSMKAMVVFLAKSMSRGRKPRYKEKRVSWVKPTVGQKEKAQKFLEGKLGKRYSLEVSQDDIDKAMKQCEAILVLD